MTADEIVTAWHEAGHAVAAEMLGYGVRWVTIRPNWEMRLSGRCVVDERRPMTPRDGAVFAAAADVAVKLHTNILEEHHRDALGDGYDAAWDKARLLLDTHEARDAVRALAERLLREKTVVFA